MPDVYLAEICMADYIHFGDVDFLILWIGNFLVQLGVWDFLIEIGVRNFLIQMGMNVFLIQVGVGSSLV